MDTISYKCYYAQFDENCDDFAWSNVAVIKDENKCIDHQQN